MKSLLERNNNHLVYNKYYLEIQEKWALKMISLTKRLSRKKLICLLVLFTALTGGFLIWNIYRAFSNNDVHLRAKDQISKIKSIHLK